MSRLWNRPHSLLAMGIVALIISAALACGGTAAETGTPAPSEALPPPTETLPPPTETLPPPTETLPPIGNWRDTNFWRDAKVANVRAKLDRGADINERFSYGALHWTPLHMAARLNKEPSVIALLLDRGADINATMSHESGTPLYWAAGFNNEPAVTALLLDRGARVTVDDTNGGTVLHIAATFNNEPLVAAVLLDRGADVNARDNFGWTPLHDAARQNHPAVVQLLLYRGAFTWTRDDDGKTACEHGAVNDALTITETYGLLCCGLSAEELAAIKAIYHQTYDLLCK